MSPLAAFVLACAGLAALAIALERHQRQVFSHLVGRGWQVLLRAVGWLGLAVSLAVCVATSGWGIGLVLWFGLLSGASLVVALLLTYRPRWIVLLCPLVLLATR